MTMEKNKNVPKIRFKGFSEEWKEKELRKVCVIRTGFPFDSVDFNDNGSFLVITNGNIQDDSAIVDNKLGNKIDISDKRIIDEYVLNIGDILVTMDGTVGRTAIVDDQYMILAQRVGRLTANDNADYLYQLLNLGVFSKEMTIASVGGTIKHISLSNIGDYLTSIPTNISEQEKIGNYFKNIDKLIATKQSRIDKLKNLKKACLEKMFPKKGATTPEIRFKGFTGEWEEKELNAICSYSSSSLSVSDACTEGQYELYDANGVIGYITSNVQESEYISIIKDGSGVGRTRILPKNTNFIGTMGGINANTDVDVYFLWSILLNVNFQTHIIGATIPHVYFSDYGHEMIYSPKSPQEQQQIGTFFKNIDELIAKNEQQLTKLKNIKKACFEKMFVNK